MQLFLSLSHWLLPLQPSSKCWIMREAVQSEAAPLLCQKHSSPSTFSHSLLVTFFSFLWFGLFFRFTFFLHRFLSFQYPLIVIKMTPGKDKYRFSLQLPSFFYPFSYLLVLFERAIPNNLWQHSQIENESGKYRITANCKKISKSSKHATFLFEDEKG